MSGPVPSPSMKGTIGSSGTWRRPDASRVIGWPLRGALSLRVVVMAACGIRDPGPSRHGDRAPGPCGGPHSARLRLAARFACSAPLLGNDAQSELLELGGVHRTRRVEQQVLAPLRLRERDHVAQAL